MKPATSQHTPTLSVIDDNGDLKATSHEYGIVAAFDDENGLPFEEATKEHRAFIVRAVNCHEELLNACKLALERWGTLPASAEIGEAIKAGDVLYKAISKAEGSEVMK